MYIRYIKKINKSYGTRNIMLPRVEVDNTGAASHAGDAFVVSRREQIVRLSEAESSPT